MESAPKPPQYRRKHSSSIKGPYDDIVFKKGGKKLVYEPHEYAEIFCRTDSWPSIPEIDIPDEPVQRRRSKPDYTTIFGAVKNDDVAVPFEDLVNGSSNKQKKNKPRIPADMRPPMQEPGAQHSSEKTKRSSDKASEQSVDGLSKQHFNVSFNRTIQRNTTDESNGKTTHIAELHAVPEFTYFVDGISQKQKTEDYRPSPPSLKREVSRTWSFSADFEALKGKGGSSGDKSNVTAINPKSHFPKVPPPSINSSNLSNDSDRSKIWGFASKQDAYEKLFGEASPTFFEEEFDENSDAAVSAAALKRTIEHAQESIRLAKMIMDRKKQGLQNGSTPSSTVRPKVKDKMEKKTDREAFGSKKKNAREENERLDPVLRYWDPLNNARKAEVERVRENVGAAVEHAEALNMASKTSVPSCSRVETLYRAENVDSGKLGENVEAAEVATHFPGLVASAEYTTANLESEQVNDKNSSVLSSRIEKLEIVKETLEEKEVPINHTIGNVDVEKLSEKALNMPKRTQDLENSAAEVPEQHDRNFHLARGPKSIVEQVENVPDTPHEPPKVEKIVEAGENLGISWENEVTEEREILSDDKGKSAEKFVECRLSDILLDESANQVEKEVVQHEETENKFENAVEWKQNDHVRGKRNDGEDELRRKESHISFESEEQLKEASEEEIYETKPEEVSPEKGEIEEPEIKQNHVYDAEVQFLPEKFEHDEVEEREMNIYEYEAADNTTTEANSSHEAQKSAIFWDAEETNIFRGGGSNEEFFVESQKSAIFWDVEETNNIVGAAENIEEKDNKCEFHEFAYGKDIDEPVHASHGNVGTTFTEVHSNDKSTIFRVSCEGDLNYKAEEYPKEVKTETFSAIDDEKAEQMFHLEDDEMHKRHSLHRSASEQIFVESTLHDTFEVTSADGRTENSGLMNADNEEKLSDADTLGETSEIHDSQVYANIDGQNSPEVHPSNNETAEFDLAYLKQVLEQTTESDEGSASTFSQENIDELSSRSEKYAENMKDLISKEEELKHEIETSYIQSEYAEERIEEVCSQLHCESKETGNTMGAERGVEMGKMEKNSKNFTETSATGNKDAKEKVDRRDDHQQRMEAIKRERERKKDRIAVERAIREARERAFAEARERAERAAVERAAAEVRQRVMAEAKQKLEKANKQPADKASIKAKLRAERAAVERATAEARQRALEKVRSQKTSTEAKTNADNYSTESLSSSSRNSGLKHSFSSSDLEKLEGSNNESAERRKARLERHQRIMERAAKALEEKNMRDLLAQKEQAERNRLAESLDADIKRWASGKEGNLRALLSTLQYILGPDSGWQIISLTEIITTAAVKKAYRKATLYVHPDKVQQRGATIQQKYICEKVFDLLKAAWNRFNSEER